MASKARKAKPIKWWGLYSAACHQVIASALWSRKDARSHACTGMHVVRVTVERYGKRQHGGADGR